MGNNFCHHCHRRRPDKKTESHDDECPLLDTMRWNLLRLRANGDNYFRVFLDIKWVTMAPLWPFIRNSSSAGQTTMNYNLHG